MQYCTHLRILSLIIITITGIFCAEPQKNTYSVLGIYFHETLADQTGSTQLLLFDARNMRPFIYFARNRINQAIAVVSHEKADLKVLFNTAAVDLKIADSDKVFITLDLSGFKGHVSEASYGGGLRIYRSKGDTLVTSPSQIPLGYRETKEGDNEASVFVFLMKEIPEGVDWFIDGIPKNKLQEWRDSGFIYDTAGSEDKFFELLANPEFLP